MPWKRVAVRDHERVLVAKNGLFDRILMAGRHYVLTPPGVCVQMEKFNTRDLVFQSKWAKYLLNERPDVVDRYFTQVRTNEVQVAMVYVDEKLFKVLTPGTSLLFWRGAVDVKVEIVDVIPEQASEPDELTSGFDDLLDDLDEREIPAGS